MGALRDEPQNRPRIASVASEIRADRPPDRGLRPAFLTPLARMAMLVAMPRPRAPRPLAARRQAEAAGRRGERLAAWWLRLKGWHIVDRRVRTPAGEVDLVARRGTLVAFVEVKTRRDAAGLDHAIDARRLARVAAAAELLMPVYARPGDDIRVDVVLIAPGTAPRHIENAWLENG